MATTRKTTSKKTVAKKSVAKKAPAKKTTKTVKKVSAAPNFWQVQFTINTVYWLIIGAAVIATGFIAVENNQRLNDVYDKIDTLQTQDEAAY